jgi:two-component system cell cycle response regulator
MAFDLGAHDVVMPGQSPDELHLRLRTLSPQAPGRPDARRAGNGLRLAVIDPLTGIHNRRYALPRLAGIAAQARDEGRISP